MKTLFALICLALLSGCQIRTFKEGGASYTAFSLGTNQAVAPFSIEAGQAGTPSYRKLESKGLTNDSTSIVESAVGAAVRAATAK